MSVLKIKKNGAWVEVWGATTGGSTGGASPSIRTTITLLADAWVGNESPYTQEVTCRGVDVNSTVDLQPSPSQYKEIQAAEITLMACNDQGRVIVYSFDGKPESDMEMQVKITNSEVIV